MRENSGWTNEVDWQLRQRGIMPGQIKQKGLDSIENKGFKRCFEHINENW